MNKDADRVSVLLVCTNTVLHHTGVGVLVVDGALCPLFLPFVSASRNPHCLSPHMPKHVQHDACAYDQT